MVRVGIIGLGGISNGVHIPGIVASPDAELTAICDIDEGKLNRVGDERKIDNAHRFKDYRELIACPDVDAVTIPTPNNVHVEIALEAVKAGKPFAVEKPLGVNTAETARLCEAVAEKHIKNMICFSYRFIPAARYARALIQSGALGRIYHVYAQYFQGWGNSDCPRIWRFCHEVSGTGTLADLGVHMIDLVKFMTGDEYTSITADNGTFIHERKSPAGDGEMLPVDVDDYSHFLTSTENGIAGVFEITRFANARGNYQRVEVYGEKGGLVYSLDAGEPLEITYKSEGGGYHRLDVPAEYNVGQMQTFIDIVNGKDRHGAADIFDGHRAQLMLEAIERSGESGAKIKL